MIIDGKAIAKNIRADIKNDITTHKLTPKLAIILANDNPASAIYVARKMAACREVGVKPVLFEFPADCKQTDLIKQIKKLNKDDAIHGVFLQLPIGDHLDSHMIIQHISPQKDVDGLTITNMGKLISGDHSGLTPCTPQGVMQMLNHEKIDLKGKHVVIIGRSLLFGKPMGQLLLEADSTVTQCHSKTKNLSDLARQADIIIAATGQPNMVTSGWVKPNAVVIDVGISRLDDGTITGDVDFESVSKIASAITPVPGGVGPMTVACLLKNTVKACKGKS